MDTEFSFHNSNHKLTYTKELKGYTFSKRGLTARNCPVNNATQQWDCPYNMYIAIM